MKTKLLSFMLFLSYFYSFSQTTTFEWAKSVGGQNFDEANSVVLDAQGNVYVTGRFQKFVGTEVDFDPGPGVYNIAAIGQYDAFVLKLNANGDFLWAKNFGGATAATGGNGIAVDSNGNVYTTGTFSYSVDFDPSPTSSFILTPLNQFGNAATDAYISKLDTNGNFVWAKNIGAQFFETGVAITTDNNNNVYVTGKFAGTLSVNTSTGTTTLSGVSSSSGFILKLDSNGIIAWAKSISGAGTEVVYAISVDDSGNVFATGNFTSATDLDPGTSVYNIMGSGIYVLKLNSSGNFVFAKGFIGNSILNCTAIKVDNSGNIFTTGSFQQTVDFNPSSSATYNLIADGATTGQDVFLSKLDNLGNFVWAKRIYSTSDDVSRALTLDNLGNVYIAPNLGFANFNIDNGPQIIGSNVNPYIMAILKFDTMGNLVAKNFIASLGTFQTMSIAVDTNYSVHTCGSFTLPTDFNPDAPVFNLTSVGQSDVFISKMKLRNEGLSVNQNNSKNTILFYPNPTNGNLNIQLSNTITNGTLKVITITGQIVSEQHNLNGTTFNFDVTSLNQGIYIVQLTNGNEVLNSKFIKQ